MSVTACFTGASLARVGSCRGRCAPMGHAMAKSKPKKSDASEDNAGAQDVTVPGDMWWWLCFLIGMLAMVGASLLGAGVPLPGG